MEQNLIPDSLEGNAVQELINSFVRLSAAMSVYTMQQMQSAVESIDPKDSIAKFKKMIDSMTDALTAQIDDNKKKTVDSISNLGADVVERTFDTFNSSGLNARDLVDSTNDMARKTADSLANIIRNGKEEKKHSTTPEPAEIVLTAH